MATPIVVAGSDVTVAQVTLSSSLSSVIGPAIGTDSAGGANITSYKWTLLNKPPGSAAVIRTATDTLASPTIDFIDTWGNYRLFVSVTDKYGVSSETRPELAPSGAFLIIRVASTRKSIEKLAAGERSWTDRYNAVVAAVEDNASSTTFDSLDTTATRAQVDELASGGSTTLHRHPAESLPISTQTGPGVVYLSEGGLSSTTPRALTRARGVWTGHFSSVVDDETPAEGGDFYRLIFRAEEEIYLTQVMCAAESISDSTATIYEIRRMNDDDFKGMDDSDSNKLLTQVSVVHAASVDDTKPWYNTHTFDPPYQLGIGEFVVVIMRQFGGTAAGASQAYAATTVRSVDTAIGANWNHIDGDIIRLIAADSTVQEIIYAESARALLQVNSYTSIPGGEIIYLKDSTGTITDTLTEGVDWIAATDNNSTALSIYNAIATGSTSFRATLDTNKVTIISIIEKGATGNSTTVTLNVDSTGAIEFYSSDPSTGGAHANPRNLYGGANNNVIPAITNAYTAGLVKIYADSSIAGWAVVTDTAGEMTFTSARSTGATGNGDTLNEISKGIRTSATATLTAADGDNNTENQFTEGEYVVMQSTDGTKRIYVLCDGSETMSLATGDVIAPGTDIGAGNIASATTDLGVCIAVAHNLNTHSQAMILNGIRAAVLSSNGHENKIVATAEVASTDGAKTITFTQVEPGPDGNETVISTASQITPSGFTGGTHTGQTTTTTAFSGGSNATGGFATDHHVNAYWRKLV